jgi:hydroxymethylglutaryl-CoA reductase
MANTPISGFTSGAPAQSTDELVIARGGANFKLTADNVRALFVSTANTFTATQTSTGNFAALNTNASTVITSTLLGAF